MRQNGLTTKQCIFVAEYLIDKNATRAAIKAGYSAKTAGSAGWRLLKNVEISTAIQRGIDKQLLSVHISANQFIDALKARAFADPLRGRVSGKMRALEILLKYVDVLNRPRVKDADIDSAMDLSPPIHR